MLAVSVEGHDDLRFETKGRLDSRPQSPSEAPVNDMAKQYDASLASQRAGPVAAAVINHNDASEPSRLKATDHTNDSLLFIVGRDDDGHMFGHCKLLPRLNGGTSLTKK